MSALVALARLVCSGGPADGLAAELAAVHAECETVFGHAFARHEMAGAIVLNMWTARRVMSRPERARQEPARGDLGARALALVLKHEFQTVDGAPQCPECGGRDLVGADETHRPGCEWGAIVEFARLAEAPTTEG